MSEAREMYCVKCGCIESAEELVYVASEDAYYCKDCLEANGFVQCEECGGWFRDGDMFTVHTSSGDTAEWCGHCVDRHAFECEHCGELFDGRNIDSRTVEHNGYHEEWCEDCAFEDAITCWECGDLVDRDYAYYVEYDDAYICEDCRDSYYTYCDNCDELFRTADLNFSGDHCVCNSCAEYDSDWQYCDECGQWIHWTQWDDDAECCVNCIRVSRRSQNARVRSYHGDEPPMQYFGKYETVFKGLGIELEIDRREADGNQKQYCLNELDELFGTHAYFKHDGSLCYGIEIVTQPHTVEAFYELPWKEILATCKNRGYSSHEVGTCGLHVHLSRTLFGEDDEEQTDNIAKLMEFYNLYWDDIIKVSRRTPEQANRWARKYSSIRKDTLKKWAKSDGYGDRYMAVNTTNNATVEIRINRGTLKLETFLATIDFVVTTALNSIKIGWADITDDYQWLKGLKKETLVYIQSRSAFYEASDHYMMAYWREEQDRREAEYARQREAIREASDIDTDLDEGLDYPFVDDEPDGNDLASDIVEMLESLSSYHNNQRIAEDEPLIF